MPGALSHLVDDATRIGWLRHRLVVLAGHMRAFSFHT